MKARDEMIDMQALVNGMSQEWQKQRSATQMTLGGLIDRLKEMDPETAIVGLGGLASYRGYYCDLAFEPTEEPLKAESLLKICQGAMGVVFRGYKGGEFQMGQNTPLWVASWGDSGDKLIDVKHDGTIVTQPDDD